MATAISTRTIATGPKINLTVTYNYWRSGNNMVYQITVSLNFPESGAWYNNRLVADLSAGGRGLWSGQEIKPRTSGKLGGKTYSKTTGNQSYAVNGGSVGVSVTIRDTNKGANYGTHSGSMAVTAPSAPSAPSAISINNNAPAPDQTIVATWNAASGGTNGVNGYEFAYSHTGDTPWTYVQVSGTSYTLNLNTAGYKHGEKLRVAVRSYSNVNGTKYYSGWTFSNTVDVKFVAPSAVTGAKLTYNNPEPIPTTVYNASWNTPNSKGTNGIKGYELQWLKNSSNFKNVVNIEGDTTTYSSQFTEEDLVPGDILSYKVRAYTTGQGKKYYSGWVTGPNVNIVSDKFIYVSEQGGDFIKHKMYISVNGGTFKELKKEKFKVI